MKYELFFTLIIAVFILTSCTPLTLENEGVLAGAAPTDGLTVYFPFTTTAAAGTTVQNLGSVATADFVVGNAGQEVVLWNSEYWLNVSEDPGDTNSGMIENLSGVFGGSGDSLTYCALIHPRNFSNDHYVFRNEPTGQKLVVYFNSAGALRFKAYDNAQDGYTGFSSGVTNHMCLVFNNSADTMKIYRNASLVNSGSIKSNDFSTDSSEGNMFNRDFSDNKWFEGYVREIRIYNRSLSLSEVNETFLNATGEGGSPPAEDTCYDDYVGTGLSYKRFTNGTYEWIGGTGCQFESSDVS